MIVTTVTIFVKEDFINEFIEATIQNHNNSIREPGNLRFDFAQCADEPCRFLLYEAYKSPADAKAHKETAHYKIWRDTVADWMALPRKGVEHVILCPGTEKGWKTL